MYPTFSKRLGIILTVLCLALVSEFRAAPITFNFTFSGASFSNGAVANGWITFSDASYAYQPVSGSQYLMSGSEVSALSLTVSGASSGNGTFTKSDFSAMTFWTPQALDLNLQLVGQAPVGQNTFWGNDVTSIDGDFNFFKIASPVPDGVNNFTLAADGGMAENMLLVSMVAVPEPATYAAILGSLALGLVVVRRRR
jgi:hypothetical protein